MPFKVEIYRGRKGLLGRTQYRARTRYRANGKVGLVTAEGYNNLADLEAAIDSHFPQAERVYLI